MQIQSSSTSFSAGQAGSMATGMPFAPYGGLASVGQGLAQTRAASAYMQGRQDGAVDGAVNAAVLGSGPRIYSPESMGGGTAGAGGDAEGAGGARGNCPDGKCSSGGSGDIGQTLAQLLQALAPMMQAIAPIAGMMGGLGGGKSA